MNLVCWASSSVARFIGVEVACVLEVWRSGGV